MKFIYLSMCIICLTSTSYASIAKQLFISETRLVTRLAPIVQQRLSTYAKLNAENEFRCERYCSKKNIQTVCKQSCWKKRHDYYGDAFAYGDGAYNYQNRNTHQNRQRNDTYLWYSEDQNTTHTTDDNNNNSKKLEQFSEIIEDITDLLNKKSKKQTVEENLQGNSSHTQHSEKYDYFVNPDSDAFSIPTANDLYEKEQKEFFEGLAKQNAADGAFKSSTDDIFKSTDTRNFDIGNTVSHTDDSGLLSSIGSAANSAVETVSDIASSIADSFGGDDD